MADDTYREVALKQAVISHGTRQEQRVKHGTTIASVVDVPNASEEVVNAARAYEQFLDRPSNELEQLADALAAVLEDLRTLIPHVPFVFNEENVAKITEARERYRQWKSLRTEPF